MKLVQETKIYPKTLLVGIITPYNTTKTADSYYQEFIALVESNGIEYDQVYFTKLREIDPVYFLSKGKLEDLIKLCQENNIEEVIFSESLSPQQERNLSRTLNCKVFDRTELILEIFEKGAHTAEGKLQVELAMLQHQKSRVSGHGIHMSQQAGQIGTRGPGETAKERELQHIERRISKLRSELKELEKHRETQRRSRLESQVPLICLIGYTNAGKSTILNTLTKSNVYAENKLFATLDTTTRELYIDNKKKGLISDTVGFIQQIPHRLIEAFKSTLNELKYAHLLMLIIDSSDLNWENHIAVVLEVLKELQVDKPILYVFNKIDKVENPQLVEFAVRNYQPHVLISANKKESISSLIDFLRNWYPENY